MYLLFTVPTKLTYFTRFVVHGHDLTSAIAQLYLTLGTMPYVIFPCVAGYSKGFLRHLGMGTITQGWSQVILIGMSGSFSLLLTINRAFAVSVRMKKWKKLIMIMYFGQVFAQVVFVLFAGTSMKDGGKDGVKFCREKLPYQYPEEMMTMNGVNMLPSKDLGLLLILYYMITFVTFYLIISGVCGSILIRSIRQHGKLSQSSQFLANQRRITLGVVYFVFLELVGLGIPIFSLAFCGFFSLGNPVVGHYAFISMSVYPIFGPYYVLMSNADYRKRVHAMIRRVNETTPARTISVTFVTLRSKNC